MTKRPRPAYLAKRSLQPVALPGDGDELDDDLGPLEPGSNPTESETSLVRSSALVAAGTALSRLTGFVRIQEFTKAPVCEEDATSDPRM